MKLKGVVSSGNSKSSYAKYRVDQLVRSYRHRHPQGLQPPETNGTQYLLSTSTSPTANITDSTDISRLVLLTVMSQGISPTSASSPTISKKV